MTTGTNRLEEEIPQFFCVHDCFATTAEKVNLLKVLLADVYTSLYSESHYMTKFDKDIISFLKSKAGIEIDSSRKLTDPNGVYLGKLHSIN